MAKSRHLYAAAEFFVAMPLAVLAQAVEALAAVRRRLSD